MNHNRILRALNVLFLSCGYQVHWFSVEVRKFQLTLVGFAYFICLLIWYGICFQEHFHDTSIFYFLTDMAPVLHRCIRLHLVMGLKVMAFTLFEMRHITKALNSLIKVLPNKTTASCWSWNDPVAYIWVYSGFLINFGFAMYIMVQMEFLMPTLQQVMHFTAMFLPHFALGCSVKLFNVTSWIARAELKNMRTRLNVISNKEWYQKNKSVLQVEHNSGNAVELSVIQKHPSSDIFSVPIHLLSEQLELLANATQKLSEVLQKQIILLFSMNSVCLLGATYSIVYYKSTWHILLDGPIGRSFLAFNYGVFVFISWDYICLCAANFCLEMEKATFVKDTMQILKLKLAIEEDTKSLLKDIRNTLERKFDMRIFFTSSITWQTFFVVNTLIGLAITIFTFYHHFKDEIENLQMRLDGD